MNGTDNDDVDRHDIHLRHALDHAPDQNAVPDWRWRKAILKRAHDAVGEPDPEDAEADLERAAQSWWQRMSGAERQPGRPKSRKPVYALIATLMIALVAVMLWRRDPERSPAIDPQVAARAPSPEDAIPIPNATPTDTVSIPLLPPSFFEKPRLPEPIAQPEPAPTPPTPPSAVAPKPAPPTKSAAAPSAPPVPPSAAPDTASASKDQKTPPLAGPSQLRPQQSQQQQREAMQVPAPVPPSPPAVSQTVRTDATEPPTFDALGQWNRMTITGRGGETRSLPRAEAREVSALMASAALSAVGPQPMKGAPEWRVTLERGADQLAVLEVSGSQVRWREGRTPAATGTPSAGSISALRDALSNAVKEPQATPGEPPRSP